MKPRSFASGINLFWIVPALAGCAFGQPAAGPLRLKLRDAVTLALSQNPQVVTANLGVARSEQEELSARAGLLPQVGANVNEAVHRNNLQAFMGLSIPGFPKHVGPFETSQLGIGFQAPVFDLTLWTRYKSSQIGVEASRAQEIGAREENVLLVVSQYLGGQRAAADVEASQWRVKLAQALYELASDLLTHGVGTGIDKLRANVQLQNEKQRLIVAKTQLDTSLFGLARLLNVDPHRAIELADQVSFFETPAAPVDQSLEQAFAARPELKQIAARLRQVELGVQAAGQSRLPRLSISGQWTELGLRPGNVIPTYQYQANIDVPLFTGGRIEAERTNAGLALRQLKQQELETRNRIAMEVKTSIARLEAARGEVDVANQGVDLAQQVIDQARDRFQAGVANNIEVVSAQDEFSRAQDNRIAALYRYNQARADLAHATGRMEALYAK